MRRLASFLLILAVVFAFAETLSVKAEEIRISGTCHDQNRNAIANAEVRLYSRSFCQEGRRLVKTIRANTNGKFDLGMFTKPGLRGVHIDTLRKPEVPVVLYQVVVTKDGMAPRVFLLPSRHLDRLEAILVPGANLIGRLVGPTRQPVEGAKVSVASLRFMGEIGTATTGPDGRFVIRDLPPWQSEMVRTSEGMKPRSARFLVVEHDEFVCRQPRFTACPGMVEIQMESPATVKGHVVHGDGTPDVGIQISAKVNDRARDPFRTTAVTDDRGEYSLRLPQTDSATVRVYDAQFVSNSIGPFAIAATETQELSDLTIRNRESWADK